MQSIATTAESSPGADVSPFPAAVLALGDLGEEPLFGGRLLDSAHALESQPVHAAEPTAATVRVVEAHLVEPLACMMMLVILAAQTVDTLLLIM